MNTEAANDNTTKRTKTKRAGKQTKKPAKAASSKRKSDSAGTKKDLVLELLRRKDGATIAEIAKATDWQNHSIRGFLSGTITKKLGIVVESSKNEAGERNYRIGD